MAREPVSSQLLFKNTKRGGIVSAIRRLALNRADAIDAHCREAILSLLERDPTAQLLDLGCADGTFTSRIARRVGTTSVCGIDAVLENIASAKARGVDACLANLDQGIPLEDESFHVICASHVIEHVCDTDLIVRETYRLLRNGGYLVIATPNLAATHNILLLIFGRQPTIAEVSDVALVGTVSPRGNCVARVGPSHRRIFTFPALRGLLEYHGYRVEKTVAAGYFPLPAILSRGMCLIDRVHSTNIVLKARKG